MEAPPFADWEVWRVVQAGYGTLVEIESGWTMADLWDANAVISAFKRAEVEADRRRPR